MRGRLGREAVFLVLVAAFAGLLEPGWPLFILVMAVAVLLVGAVELLLSRRPPAAAAPEAAAPEAGVPAAVGEPEGAPEMGGDAERPPSAIAPPPSVAPVLTPPEPLTLPPKQPSPPEREVEATPAPPREWNLDELERLARERAGTDPVRDQERSFLLVYLRAFVQPDGLLPQDFDGLVRESFGELLSSRP